MIYIENYIKFKITVLKEISKNNNAYIMILLTSDSRKCK